MGTKEEIISGIKNALARGESIEKIVQSFVNAGYNADTVRQAAGEINLGVTGSLLRDESESEFPPPLAEQQQQNPPISEKSGKKFPWKIILLIIVLIALIGALAGVWIYFT